MNINKRGVHPGDSEDAVMVIIKSKQRTLMWTSPVCHHIHCWCSVDIDGHIRTNIATTHCKNHPQHSDEHSLQLCKFPISKVTSIEMFGALRELMVFWDIFEGKSLLKWHPYKSYQLFSEQYLTKFDPFPNIIHNGSQTSNAISLKSLHIKEYLTKAFLHRCIQICDTSVLCGDTFQLRLWSLLQRFSLVA